MKKPRAGGITHGGATSMGPFYKKQRGYASSQLEVRRESSHPRTSAPVNNQIALMNSSLGYEKSQSLYSGQRDLGSQGSQFHVEIFLSKKG